LVPNGEGETFAITFSFFFFFIIVIYENLRSKVRHQGNLVMRSSKDLILISFLLKNAQVWIDKRLAWDPEDHSQITKLRVPAAEIWVPDISLYNE
jgi:hypothetical protein